MNARIEYNKIKSYMQRLQDIIDNAECIDSDARRDNLLSVVPSMRKNIGNLIFAFTDHLNHGTYENITGYSSKFNSIVGTLAVAVSHTNKYKTIDYTARLKQFEHIIIYLLDILREAYEVNKDECAMAKNLSERIHRHDNFIHDVYEEVDNFVSKFTNNSHLIKSLINYDLHIKKFYDNDARNNYDNILENICDKITSICNIVTLLCLIDIENKVNYYDFTKDIYLLRPQNIKYTDNHYDFKTSLKSLTQYKSYSDISAINIMNDNVVNFNLSKIKEIMFLMHFTKFNYIS